jgi:cell division protein FtsN
MSRDYKQRPIPQQGLRKKSRGSLLLGLLVGFVFGLAVAAAIAVYFFKSPLPFMEKSRAADKPVPSGQNLADAPKTAKADEKPRFDFYRILPGQEEPVSDKQMREAAKQTDKPGALKETYFLQAGAFQNPADADNLKAKLALMGYEASVEPTNIAEKGTWYRVRLGPYNRVEDINRVRQQMADNGVQASLIRIKDPAQKN